MVGSPLSFTTYWHHWAGLSVVYIILILSERFLYVTTTQEQPSALAVSAGARSASGRNMVTFTFQLLHSFSVIGYVDDHTLLKTIPLKSDWLKAADKLNTDLIVLSQFRKWWHMDFAPLKNKALFIL